MQSLKWTYEFTGPNEISWICFYLVLNKKWKILLVRTVLLVLNWAQALVLIVRTVNATVYMEIHVVISWNQSIFCLKKSVKLFFFSVFFLFFSFSFFLLLFLFLLLLLQEIFQEEALYSCSFVCLNITSNSNWFLYCNLV